MKSETETVADTLPTVQNDSYRYRIVEKPLTNLQAFMYIIKGTFGTGILVLPLAFMEAGLVAGLIGTILIGFFSTYCLHILLESKREICKRMSLPMVTYSIAFMLALRCGPKIFRSVSKYSSFLNTASGVATLYGMAHSTNQTDGVVMGSPLSPVVANLFMERCENFAVETAVAFGHREEINWTGFLNI
ncbi:hypothetical protein Trydic_g12986 [Trypoxylus dichotomus]